MTLIAAVQAIADEPLKGHPQRRKGMRPEMAQRIVAEVVAEALAIVEPWAERQWDSAAMLKRLRDLRLTRISPRRLDDDNLQAAFKGVRDEVAAYFHIDDRDPRIRFEYAQAAGKPSRVDIAFDIDSKRDMRAAAVRNAEAARARIDAEVARLTDTTPGSCRTTREPTTTRLRLR